MTEPVEKTTYTAPDDSDRLIVSWVFSTAVLIDRQEPDGPIALISTSDWAQAQIFKSDLLKDPDATAIIVAE